MSVAILGWLGSAFKNGKDAREKRLLGVEDKVNSLDKVDTRNGESIKRVHYRMDVLENSQTKLELKLDSDILDVKHSIEKLTDLVIEAIKDKRG